jgi:transposase
VRRARHRCSPTQGALSNYKIPAAGHDREALGRPRGGLTTKVHLAADRRCRPIARVITSGQRHDSVAFSAVLAGVRIRRPWPGRARTRPARVLADKAYANRTIRGSLCRRGILATIPEPADRQANRARLGRRGGRPPTFDSGRYKERNVVERCINKLKHHRAAATRYDKRESMYQGTVDVASIRFGSGNRSDDPPDRPSFTELRSLMSGMSTHTSLTTVCMPDTLVARRSISHLFAQLSTDPASRTTLAAAEPSVALPNWPLR